MPTDKTIGTELGLCFGVLDINPSKEIDEMLKVQNVDRENLGRFLSAGVWSQGVCEGG